jgi:hypothetical protein
VPHPTAAAVLTRDLTVADLALDATVPREAASSLSTSRLSAADLAPDLLALVTGAKPHPDMAAFEPVVTVAGLVAAARRAAQELGAPVAVSAIDGRVAVAGLADLAQGQVRLVTARGQGFETR